MGKEPTPNQKLNNKTNEHNHTEQPTESLNH